MSEISTSERRGRLTMVNIPLEIIEAMEHPAIAMHVYTRVAALSRHDRMQFTKGTREITLERGECVFFARKFCERWNYSRPTVTRTVKTFEKLGFWTIIDTRDGFTIRVRPLQKVPGFVESQVFELNRVSKTLISEARRDFLLEQARALARADQGLYRGLSEEFRAISDSYNTSNATEKPGYEPEKSNTNYMNSSQNSTQSENSPAAAGLSSQAAVAAALNAALGGPPVAFDEPSASSVQECGLSASEAAPEPLDLGEAASGGAGEVGDWSKPPKGFWESTVGSLKGTTHAV